MIAASTSPQARSTDTSALRTATRKRRRMGFGIGLALVSLVGCSGDSDLTPVHGKVLLDGRPLEFGSIMFQPESGPPARATIQADGTFELSTSTPGDGAKIGRNRVRITCYEAQRSGAISASDQEMSLGELLIPKRYTSYGTSGLEKDLQAGNTEPLVFDLKGE